MLKIMIEPEDIWTVFTDNKKILEDNMLTVARDDIIEICLTNERGMPYFVCIDDEGKREYEEHTTSKKDAEETYESILTMYNDPVEDFSAADQMRLDDIFDATVDYLRVLLDDSPDDYGFDTEDEVLEFAGKVEKLLIDEYGYVVKHPNIVVDEDGCPEYHTTLFEMMEGKNV